MLNKQSSIYYTVAFPLIKASLSWLMTQPVLNHYPQLCTHMQHA